jgi:hypothetical protein
MRSQGQTGLLSLALYMAVLQLLPTERLDQILATGKKINSQKAKRNHLLKQ